MIRTHPMDFCNKGVTKFQQIGTHQLYRKDFDSFSTKTCRKSQKGVSLLRKKSQKGVKKHYYEA